jgi:hypothetical protein
MSTLEQNHKEHLLKLADDVLLHRDLDSSEITWVARQWRGTHFSASALHSLINRMRTDHWPTLASLAYQRIRAYKQ